MVAGVGMAIYSHQPLGIVLAGWGFLLTARAVVFASTRIDEKGVSQLGWRGRTHVPWSDVTHLTQRPESLTLEGSAGRLVVPVAVFENTAATIAYIESHLPSDSKAGR
jgi:hypothetical protein